jgi:chemotaxis protein methyltransferase CheR
VRPELRSLVRFGQLNLQSPVWPAQQRYDVIFCRNVVIYFDRAMQERLFTLFADALAPGGMLLLGKVETLFGPARERLVLEEPRERIYRLAGS